MIKKSTFKCKQCGECCRGTVIKLDHKDIKRIEEVGYQDFTMSDPLGSSKPVLKRSKEDRNTCIFLEQKGKIYSCKIYNARPKICRIYPFGEEDKLKDCKPEWPVPSLESLRSR